MKERLGSQLKKHPPPIKERVKAKSSISKPHNEPKVKAMDAKPKGSKTESKSGKKLPLVAEEPVNFERLEVILNKSMGEFCQSIWFQNQRSKSSQFWPSSGALRSVLVFGSRCFGSK